MFEFNRLEIVVLRAGISAILGRTIIVVQVAIRRSRWMAADASLVVRGTVNLIKTTTELEDNGNWLQVSIRVDETLKGEHQAVWQF